MRRYSLLALAMLAIAVPARAADWGNLKGRFVYGGSPPTPKSIDTSKEPMCSKHKVVDESIKVGKGGGLANVVLFVNTKKVKINPEYESTAKDKVVLDNNGCRFEPHILPIRVTQHLEIKNSDPFSHNSNVAPLGDEAKNPLLSPDTSILYDFHRVQKTPVPISCNIHPWMKGYVVVKDHPYVAVSDEDGNFEIKDLPAEELEFIAWHENQGYLSAKKDWKKGVFKMKIKKGDNNDLGEIKVDPSLVAPKS